MKVFVIMLATMGSLVGCGGGGGTSGSGSTGSGSRPSSVVIDSDGNGSVDHRITLSYNAQDRVVTVSIDANLDGAPDSVLDFTYNGSGLLDSWREDIDANGVDEEIETYNYDPQGRFTISLYDWDGNGTFDRSIAYDFNASNLVTHRRVDNGNNGSVEQDIIYTRDPQGQIVQKTTTIALGQPPVPTDTWTLTYDGNNQLISAVEDDGSADEINVFSYSMSGLITGWIHDSNADGTNDKVVEFLYDVDGRLSTVNVYNAGSNSPNWVATLSYEVGACNDFAHYMDLIITSHSARQIGRNLGGGCSWERSLLLRDLL